MTSRTTGTALAAIALVAAVGADCREQLGGDLVDGRGKARRRDAAHCPSRRITCTSTRVAMRQPPSVHTSSSS